MDPSNPNQQVSRHSRTVLAVQQVEAAESTAANSEIGSIGQDVGSVIGKWQEKLNQALNQWLDDANSIEDLLSTAHSVVSELKGMIKAYKKYSGHLAFTDTQYDRMINMMEDLGVPLSMVEGGAVGSNGYHDFTGTQYLYDIKLAMQYLIADFPSFQSSISGYKNAETKDLFGVMVCMNGVKMNEESLSGIMEMLASLSQSLMQNIQ